MTSLPSFNPLFETGDSEFHRASPTPDCASQALLRYCALLCCAVLCSDFAIIFAALLQNIIYCFTSSFQLSSDWRSSWQLSLPGRVPCQDTRNRPCYIGAVRPGSGPESGSGLLVDLDWISPSLLDLVDLDLSRLLLDRAADFCSAIQISADFRSLSGSQQTSLLLSRYSAIFAPTTRLSSVQL